MGRLFFQADGLVVPIELDHAVALRVVHVVGEYSGSSRALHRVEQQLLEVVAVIDVVAQHQCTRVVADE
ncbi:hypothetical protein D3C81_2219130 [compost metagenome]